MSKSPCNCPVCRAVDQAVHPVAPSTELDPWAMEPGDAQRALAVIYEIRQRELGVHRG